MRKQIKFLLVILSFFLVLSPAWAEKTEKIAVFPVNVLIKNGSYPLYPNILSLISGDLINTLDKKSSASVIDLTSMGNVIKDSGLSKKYHNLLLDYKTYYTIDYDTCAILAEKLGVNRILLVSGGFDVQRMLMKRSLLFQMDIPFARPMVPCYRLDVTLTLVDPQTGQVTWEKTYKNDFEAKDFTLSTQNYSENIISVEKIKQFSYKLADNATLEMDKVFNSVITNVHSDIAPKAETLEETTTDGVMTKDGHFSSSEDYPLTKRLNDYKGWVKEKVQSQQMF